MKYNLMFDVAFDVEGPWATPEEVPAEHLLLGLQNRVAFLLSAFVNKSEDITEAFGFCDAYPIDEIEQP